MNVDETTLCAITIAYVVPKLGKKAKRGYIET